MVAPIRALFVFLATSGICYAQSGMVDISPEIAGLEQMEAVERQHFDSPSSIRANAVMDAYGRMKHQADMTPSTRRTPHDLRTRLQAARMALVHRPGPDILRDINDTIVQLSTQNGITPSDAELVYDAAIASRRFDKARQVKRAYPQIDRPTPPNIVSLPYHGAHGVPVFALAANGHDLRTESLDIQSGRWLVVISSPSCAFSNRASAYFSSEEAFRTRLGDLGIRTIWLQPVERALHVDRAKKWSTDHPHADLYWARFQSDWPHVENWDTPTFHLIENGRLVGTTTGWREPDSRASIDLLLRRLTEASPAAPLPAR